MNNFRVVAGVREPKFFAWNLSTFFAYQGQFSIRHIKRWRSPVFLIKKKAFLYHYFGIEPRCNSKVALIATIPCIPFVGPPAMGR
jgi:hypothetical protein